MNIATYLIGLVLMFTVVFKTSAQQADWRADMSRLIDVMEGNKPTIAEVEYVLYRNHTTTEPLERMSCTTIRQGREVWQKCVGTIEYLQTAQYIVMVDHLHQVLVITDAGRTGIQDAPIMSNDLSLKRLDSLLTVAQAKVEVKPASSGKMLRIAFKNIESPYRTIDIYYTHEYQMTKAVLFLTKPNDAEDMQPASPPRMELVVKRFELNPLLPKDTFVISRYVSLRNGKYSLQPAFSKFRLLNQLAIPAR